MQRDGGSVHRALVVDHGVVGMVPSGKRETAGTVHAGGLEGPATDMEGLRMADTVRMEEA